MARKKAHVLDDQPLQLAFQVVDKTSEKLDALKQRYNETAAELIKATPLPPPAPMRPPFDSRYKAARLPSIDELPPLVAPNPNSALLPPRPSLRAVPRPNPKSGRFFIQLRDAKDPQTLRALRETISKTGRVVDSGAGTASSPESGWLEVAAHVENTSDLISKLDALHIRENVEKIIEVAPGEGRIQARQLDLFRKKHDSHA